MKNFKLIASIFFVGLLFSNCDKIENPIKPAILLDTTIFPGNWEDYPEPTWAQNTNTNRNILLEDFTGHRCPNCPVAATEAKNIEDANPDRVFVASIHAAPGGLSDFQKTLLTCGTGSNPNNEFCTEFFNDEGVTYGETFQTGFGFFGNPSGNLSRIKFGTNIFLPYTNWSTNVNTVLTENDLKVNIQAVANYYSETNGFYLHAETEFLENLTGNYSIVTYLIEKEKVDFQDSASIIVDHYHHHNIFRGCLDGQAWGQSIATDPVANSKYYFDYSYKLPTGQTNSEFHVLIYVYNVETYEVMQVIKVEL